MQLVCATSKRRVAGSGARARAEQITQHCDVLFGADRPELPDEVVNLIKQKLRKPQRTDSMS